MQHMVFQCFLQGNFSTARLVAKMSMTKYLLANMVAPSGLFVSVMQAGEYAGVELCAGQRS